MKTFKLTFTTKIAITALVLALAGTCMFGVGSAYALSLGTNITKPDGVTTRTYGGHTYNATGTGVGNEDNEAEPGMIQSQAWDLDGFS